MFPVLEFEVEFGDPGFLVFEFETFVLEVELGFFDVVDVDGVNGRGVLLLRILLTLLRHHHYKVLTLPIPTTNHRILTRIIIIALLRIKILIHRFLAQNMIHHLEPIRILSFLTFL